MSFTFPTIKNFIQRENIKNYLSIAVSAGMLVLAYPKTDIWILAWFGFVPMLFVLDGKKRLEAFKIGFLTGALFFAGTLYWFIHVTVIGAALLIGYLALYFGLFAVGYSFVRPSRLSYKVLFVSSLWVVCEYMRAHLFSGFGWASLGHSQYKNLLMIQIADVTGVFGVSFMVMMANVAVKEIIGLWASKKTINAETKRAGTLVLTVLMAAAIYGKIALDREQQKIQQAKETISVAVVQANIAQQEKWQESSWPMVIKKHADLTSQTARQNPDLIIWPETSFPGFLWEDVGYFTYLRDFVDTLDIPLLFGSVIHEDEHYYNGAILLSASGKVDGVYHKLHLVPFGEFLPFRRWMPLVADFIPIEDFTSGEEFTHFNYTSEKNNQFSTLICFEDTVAYLSRQFTKKGSGLLVNITNDAWFKDTKAPFMHLQSSVFRSVENRRYLIRAANTGVSAFVNPVGRIVQRVQDNRGKPTYVQGFALGKVQFRNDLSFYTKFGDVFTLLCAACILSGFWIVRRKNKKKNEQS